MNAKFITYNPNLKQLARKLRNNSTKSEVALWTQIKGKFLGKYDFHRQKPIDQYIADFYCPKLELVIEIDGFSHSHESKFQKDIIKEKRFRELGLNVLRFSEADILSNLENVLNVIEDFARGFESGEMGWLLGKNTPLNPLSRGDT